ncbi:class I SAM-dependent methyltransferase [Catenulispora subtropica]|uniref:Methyltransferase n=1 Tax=Catenulispora subtropica TaxID=450798 RepID=A0ABN2TDB7_9ACTN
MRLALRGGNPLERAALRANLVPAPAAEAWGGLAVSGVLVAAVRTGIVARLASAPGSAAQIAADLGLAPTPTRLLLECLVSTGHVKQAHDGSLRLARRNRRWLDPDSEVGVARFVNACGDYFDWWRDLDRLVVAGAPVEHHDRPPDDPYWRRYILGQLDLARLTAPEVARRLTLRPGAGHVLDVGGGHGWYAATLCRARPGLTATVLDLPGSARIGREVIAAAGLSHLVSFTEGDARQRDFPAGQDVVLCFNLLHHLTETEIPTLLRRAHAALEPGGTLAILDAFAEPRQTRTDPAATHLALFVRLTSGSTLYTPDQLATWLHTAGFTPPRRIRSARIPGLALYQAGKRW